MHNAKRHFPAFKRPGEPRYPSKPATGLPEPTEAIPVHFMDGNLFAICRVAGAGMRIKTNKASHVTCRACLKQMKKDLGDHGSR